MEENENTQIENFFPKLFRIPGDVKTDSETPLIRVSIALDTQAEEERTGKALDPTASHRDGPQTPSKIARQVGPTQFMHKLAKTKLENKSPQGPMPAHC